MAGEINFGILNQNLPAEIAGSYYKGQEQQQQNALAKQQLSQAQMSTQVSGMQLEKMKRDAAALDQMQKAIVGSGGPPDLKTAFQAMINSGMPDHVNSGIAGLQKLQEHEQFRNIMGGRAAAPAAGGGGMSEPYEGYNAEIGAPAGAATNEPYPGYNAAIGAPTGNALAPAPTTNALAPQPANAKTAKIAELRGKIDDFIALGTPRALAAAKVMEADLRQLMTPPVYHNVPGVGLVDPSTSRVVTPEVPKPQNLNETQQLLKDLKTETDPAARKVLQNRLDFLGRHPPVAQPRAEPTPVAVLDPVTKKPILVRPERAVKEGLTPANMAEKVMTPLQKQAFKKDFANDTSKVQSATNTADELEKLTDELVGNPDKEIKPHPGLGGITGYLGILPSLPKGEAAKAEQKLDTFKGKIKSLGRAIASQEGKLGNMAVQEWQMVSDAVQNISPRAGNLDVQMRDVVRQARDLARNMKEKFDLTYEDAAPTTAPKEVNFGSLK